MLTTIQQKADVPLGGATFETPDDVTSPVELAADSRGGIHPLRLFAHPKELEDLSSQPSSEIIHIVEQSLLEVKSIVEDEPSRSTSVATTGSMSDARAATERIMSTRTSDRPDSPILGSPISERGMPPISMISSRSNSYDGQLTRLSAVGARGGLAGKIEPPESKPEQAKPKVGLQRRASLVGVKEAD